MFEKLGVRNNLVRLVKANFSLYRIILICIVICYEFECISMKTIMRNPNIKFTIAMRDVSLLLILPLFISLLILFINYLKNKITNKKMSEEYYRDILNEISCTELTYIDDNNVELKKDIIATLLELKLKKKIKFENNKIIVVNREMYDLAEHEKYVLKKLDSISSSDVAFTKGNIIFKNFLYNIIGKNRIINEFEEVLTEDLKKSEILEEKAIEKFEKKYKKIKRIVSVIFTLILIFAGSGDSEIASVFSFCLLYFLFGWCLVKIPRPKKKWNLLKQIAFYITVPWLAFIIVLGMLMFPLIAEECQEEMLVFFKYFFTIITIITIGIESYLILNSKKLTTKGNGIKKKLCGLKMYLNDFSTMKSKNLNEIDLWDEYIIYSVILNENKKITREVWRILKNTFSKE